MTTVDSPKEIKDSKREKNSIAVLNPRRECCRSEIWEVTGFMFLMFYSKVMHLFKNVTFFMFLSISVKGKKCLLSPNMSSGFISPWLTVALMMDAVEWFTKTAMEL